jgi:hypothetical protein
MFGGEQEGSHRVWQYGREVAVSKFDDFSDVVLKGAKDLAKNSFGGFVAEAANDTQAFLDKAQADLQRWVKLLANGKLTKQDFSDLVQAKKALAEIHALTQAGITLTKVERFRSALITLVIDSAFDVFL